MLVAPEGLALVAARDRQRRGQGETRVLPPARSGIRPAEHVQREHGTLGVDHRFLRGDIRARCRAQTRERQHHFVQCFRRRPDIVEGADRDAVGRIGGDRRWHDEHLWRSAWMTDSNAVPPGDALNFNLSEEQQLLRDAVERFASERYDVPKRAAYRANPAGYSAENWAELASLGVLALPFDAEDGGLGGGAVELMTVMEALGRALAVEPVLEEIVISAGLVAAAGTAAQKAHWLPAVIAGEAHLALAHVERSARFDLDDVRTTARVAEGVGYARRRQVLRARGRGRRRLPRRGSPGGCGRPGGHPALRRRGGCERPGAQRRFVWSTARLRVSSRSRGCAESRSPAASESSRRSSSVHRSPRRRRCSGSCRCCSIRRSSTSATAGSLARRWDRSR